MIEVPTYQDYKDVVKTLEDVSKKHNELVELMKSTSFALGKMQEELEEMPSGYRNAHDIKNLKARIERLEARGYDVTAQEISSLKECCHNTVASGKALEARVESLSIEVGDASKRTQRADKFMDNLRNI